MSISDLSLSQRNSKKVSLWTVEKRKKLLKMCGYFPKEEMAKRLGVTVAQLMPQVARMGASYRVTKNIEDYIE
tara:strand:+ start:228 stop:446 length:219 start_codon:yes stop_codon:yes gene_type:complete